MSTLVDVIQSDGFRQLLNLVDGLNAIVMNRITQHEVSLLLR
ncbi:Uncharacterised protein [Vibrio cholerae]|nr:Uncharacterised protein [Vibrio cholerae]